MKAKELTIEEKAKAYDRALANAKEQAIDGYLDAVAVNDIFPELKQSEDDRIREKVIDVLKLNVRGAEAQMQASRGIDRTFEVYACNKVIAWLEKQGEQKPADKLEPKFNVGDVMRTLQEATNNITSGLPVVVSIDNEYYHCTNELIAIKDQNNYEYPPINRIQKPAWSEEDEEIHRKCICAMRASACGFPEEEKFVEQVDNWLKSLKERYTWRPSEGQMKALEWQVANTNESSWQGKASKELLEQLKQL